MADGVHGNVFPHRLNPGFQERMSIDQVTGLVTQVLAEAPPPNQPLQLARTKTVEYMSRFRLTQFRSNPQKDPIGLDQALEVVNQVYTQYPHFQGANVVLVMIHHLMRSTDKVISSTQRSIKGIQRQRSLNHLLGIMLEQLLSFLSLYIQKEANVLDPASMVHQVTLQNMANSNELYERLKSEVLANYPKNSILLSLFDAFKACTLLFEKDPQTLVADVKVEREGTIEQKLCRATEEFALIRQIVEGLPKYCPFDDAINWTFPFNNAHKETIERWLGPYPTFVALLSQMNASAEPLRWLEVFESLKEIYRSFIETEHISPLLSICMHYANQGIGIKFEGVWLAGGFVTLYGISHGLISKIQLAITHALSLVIERTFANTDWASIGEPLSFFLTVISEHHQLLGSELIKGLLAEIDHDLIPSAPFYSIADCLKKDFQKKHAKPSQEFIQMRDDMERLHVGISEPGSCELAVALASALQQVYERRRGFQIDLALLTADIERLASFGYCQDQSTISPIAREACLSICIRLAYSITFSVRICSHLIESLERTIEGSMGIGPTEQSVSQPPAARKKKKRKKAAASVPSLQIIPISDHTPASNPPSPLKRTVSDGVVSSPLMGEERVPSLKMQLVQLCHDLQVRHPEAESYFKNLEVFLEVYAEHGDFRLTVCRLIETLKATSKAFEFAILGLLAIYLDPTTEFKTHQLDCLAYPLFTSRAPENVKAALIEAWQYIERLSPANAVIHYPLTSQFSNRWLVTRLLEARKIGSEKQGELQQMAEDGWALIFSLLKAAHHPSDQGGPLDIPPLRSRLDERGAEPDSDVTSPWQELSSVPSMISPPLAQSTIDQIQAWIRFIQTIPVTGKSSVPDCTDSRNCWLKQAEMFSGQLQELLREPESLWGHHTVLGVLDWTRRLVKAVLAATLFHHGEREFNERQNNPRRLAERLPEEIRLAIGVPPPSLSYAQEVSARPIRPPFSRGAGCLQSIVDPILPLLRVSQIIREDPGQDGYQIGGEIVTPGQHQSRMMALTRQALHMTIHPSLSYTMTVLEQGFMPK